MSKVEFFGRVNATIFSYKSSLLTSPLQFLESLNWEKRNPNYEQIYRGFISDAPKDCPTPGEFAYDGEDYMIVYQLKKCEI